jgi:hypothetical protein
MRKTIGYILAVALSFLSASSLICGQELIHYQLVKMNRTAADSYSRPDLRFSTEEDKIAAGTFDSGATPVLRAAEAHTKAIFNLPSLRFQRAVTERIATGRQRGDVLIVEWRFQESFGTGVIVLTDTPYYLNYAFRLSNCKIESQADLTTLLMKMLTWGKATASPSDASAFPTVMTVHLPLGATEITFFDGSIPSISPYLHVADFEFSGLLENKQWYIDFGIGKVGASSYSSVPPYVPERFPPLDDLAKSWNFSRIRTSIGDPVRPWEGGADFTERRDRILIAELVRRGLSHDEVIDLLRSVEPATASSYYSRLNSVIAGFKDAGKGPFDKLFFKAALEAYESIGPVASASVGILFGDAVIRGCAPDVETQAIEVLKRRSFPEAAFGYLRQCATSNETIAAVEAMAMPTQELEKERMSMLQEIRRHIEHPVKPLKKSP